MNFLILILFSMIVIWRILEYYKVENNMILNSLFSGIILFTSNSA